MIPVIRSVVYLILATLITAGAWLRALQVGSRAAEMSGEAKADELLSQASLVAYLREDLDILADGEFRKQEVELKDEAEGLQPDRGALALAEPGRIPALDCE